MGINVGKRERILYYDLIKLVATICVFTCHFTRSLEQHGIGFMYKVLPDTVFSIYLGNFGVTLFFIVSGATLMYVYEKHLDIKKYLKKRFIGIYPLFWLTYILAFFITFYSRGIDWGIPKWRIIYSVLGVDGNMLWFYPTFYMVGEWFLSVIVLLYIIFPILRYGVQKNPWLLLIGSVLLLILLTIFWESVLPLDCLFLARIFEFVFGMFFVQVVRKPKAYLAAAGGAVLVAILAFTNELSIINSTIRTAIVGVAMFSVLTWILQGIRGEIPQKISRFVNKYMYGFFLSHHFIQQEVLRKFSGTNMTIADVLLAYVLCLTITIIITIWLNGLNEKILRIIQK